MPEPKQLKIGDRIKFVSLPEEWQDPKSLVTEEDIKFMKIMIVRRWPSRVCGIDEYGTPWIDARTRGKRGWEWHSWSIFEKTGWRLVAKRH